MVSGSHFPSISIGCIQVLGVCPLNYERGGHSLVQALSCYDVPYSSSLVFTLLRSRHDRKPVLFRANFSHFMGSKTSLAMKAKTPALWNRRIALNKEVVPIVVFGCMQRYVVSSTHQPASRIVSIPPQESTSPYTHSAPQTPHRGAEFTSTKALYSKDGSPCQYTKRILKQDN